MGETVVNCRTILRAFQRYRRIRPGTLRRGSSLRLLLRKKPRKIDTTGIELVTRRGKAASRSRPIRLEGTVIVTVSNLSGTAISKRREVF